MGICFEANGGKKNPDMEFVRPLKNGIAIRCVNLDDDMPALKVYFGEKFGCVNFQENI